MRRRLVLLQDLHLTLKDKRSAQHLKSVYIPKSKVSTLLVPFSFLLYSTKFWIRFRSFILSFQFFWFVKRFFVIFYSFSSPKSFFFFIPSFFFLLFIHFFFFFLLRVFLSVFLPLLKMYILSSFLFSFFALVKHFPLMHYPVGWGCRIRLLHLCRGVKPHHQRVLANNLMARFQWCWNFEEYGVPLHCYRSQAQSDPEW